MDAFRSLGSSHMSGTPRSLDANNVQNGDMLLRYRNKSECKGWCTISRLPHRLQRSREVGELTSTSICTPRCPCLPIKTFAFSCNIGYSLFESIAKRLLQSLSKFSNYMADTKLARPLDCLLHERVDKPKFIKF